MAISLAAAAALRELGASSATVCTPSSNVGAVPTYASAGFRRCPDVTDFPDGLTERRSDTACVYPQCGHPGRPQDG